MTVPPPSIKPARWHDPLAIVLMCAAVAFVYWAPRPPDGEQLASDYYALHIHRISFAREALLGPSHTLPAWYPRELLGTPFWSNIQNFPFIPTRLFLLMFDPAGRYTYTIGITLAAMLGAIFTYLYARRIGIGPVGSAAAGWTFVSCGYFAARMAAGHLPLLEVYGALPLLLWCVEALVQERESGRPIGRWILALGVSSICVMLAGHPQLPVYAMAAAGVYAIWRSGLRRSILPVASMALGAGCAAFALLPMAMLIGRSTRVLHLAAAGNDLALPYGRLLGFFLPWWDGAPEPLLRSAGHPFSYPTPAYFWDTFCYAGWAPWIAVCFLIVMSLRARAVQNFCPQRRTIVAFIAILGVAGIVLALPIAQRISSILPGTFLRSPARLLYFTEFALALALGAAIQTLLRSGWANWAPSIVVVVLLGHAIDVGMTSREFDLRGGNSDTSAVDRAIEPLLSRLEDGRVGVDVDLGIAANRQYDDVGFFDSVMLAKPYLLLLDLTRAPVDYNEQKLDAGQLAPRALEATGVRVVLTRQLRPDLHELGAFDSMHVYATNLYFRRAGFFSAAQVPFVDDKQLRDFIREPDTNLVDYLPMPRSVMPATKPPSISDEPATVGYTRPSSDRIQCSVRNGQFGYLRLIESWDPGWRATVDGAPTPIVPAMGALLAVPLPPGTHEVIFEYHTPGAIIGIVLTLICATGLGVLAWRFRDGGQKAIIPANASPESAHLAAER